MPPPRDRLPRLDGKQHNELPESVSSREPETTRLVTTVISQSARSKRKHKSKLVRELEAYNRSPGPSPDSEEDELFVRQSEIPKPKRRKSRIQLFVRQSETPEARRKSKMLRDLEAHNQSPEPESEHAAKILHDLKNDWSDLGLTRGARKDLEDILSGRTPTPKKSLNVKKLMLEEFSGKAKGTKTFYAEDAGNLALLSYRRQQKCMNLMGESDGEEEDLDLLQNVSTNGRSYPQPITPARRTMPQQVRMSMGESQRDEDMVELVWPVLDKQRGQSALGSCTVLLFCLSGAKV